MKEKRHVCFGGALTKGKKLKYITYLVLKSYASQASVIFVNHNEFFFCLWRKHQSALAAWKTKKTITFEWKKSPLDYDANVTSLKLSNIHYCQSVTSCFEAIWFMHFISFHLRLSPFFASAIVVHIVADRMVFFFTAKLKVYLYLFFYFSVFSIFFTEGKIQLCFTRLDRQYTFSSHRTG